MQVNSARGRPEILRDWQFGAALVAGPLFWAALWLSTKPPVDLLWPSREPLSFLVPAVLYPVLEEIIFRGGVQTFLLNRSVGQGARFGVTVANLLTSSLFSLAHLAAHTVLWSAAVFFPSLVFGYFRERHASILPPTVLHVFYNAGYFWLFAGSL